MTVTWNVDYLKVYHKYPVRVTKFAAYLSLIYGKNIKVTRGKVHDYFCMDLIISMIKYFQKFFYAFPD